MDVEQANANVMEGKVLIYSTWVKALFNTGAPYSFISVFLVRDL